MAAAVLTKFGPVLRSRSFLSDNSYSFTKTGYPKRQFWGWLNAVFNRYDANRVKEVGPDRACAEWLLRCGAFVKWKDYDSWTTDYNLLPSGNLKRYKILEIDGTDSAVMHIGFPHLKGLKYLRKIKFHKSYYLEDRALEQLRFVKDTLEDLQVTTCGNVTDEGLKSLSQLSNLKELYIFDLPEVQDLQGCFKYLQARLPQCRIDAVSLEEMEQRRKARDQQVAEEKKT